MQFSTQTMTQASALFETEIQQYLQANPDLTFGDLEQALQSGLQQLGTFLLGQVMSGLEERYPQPERSCPCGGKAHYVRRRPAKILSLFGKTTYQRNYYLCPDCHKGQSPLDQRLGIQPGAVSPRMASLLAWTGAETAFEAGAAWVDQVLQVPVSDNTVRKETQQFGALQAQQEEAWRQQMEDPQHLQMRQREAAERPQRLYGSLDGLFVPLQKEWRELKVGAWYQVERKESAGQQTQDPEQHLRATQIRYYCDITPAAEFGRLVWASGGQSDADLAEEVVFVADGAAWIWNLVAQHFPGATQIVDWYHAVSYLAPLAEAAFGLQTPEGQAWLEQVREDLWQGQIQAVIRACRALGKRRKVRAAAQTAVTYYQNNQSRMDYARFRERGYLIGSGVVESAAKQIGSFRLKRTGARWTEDGARWTAKARAARLSGDWASLSALRSQLPVAA